MLVLRPCRTWQPLDCLGIQKQSGEELLARFGLLPSQVWNFSIVRIQQDRWRRILSVLWRLSLSLYSRHLLCLAFLYLQRMSMLRSLLPSYIYPESDLPGIWLLFCFLSIPGILYCHFRRIPCVLALFLFS